MKSFGKSAFLGATALVLLSALPTRADVSLSGYGRFGLDYRGTTADTGANRSTNETEPRVTMRLRFNIDSSVEAETGVTFGGRIRMQYDDPEPRIGVAGNIYSGIDGYRLDIGAYATGPLGTFAVGVSPEAAFTSSFGIGTYFSSGLESGGLTAQGGHYAFQTGQDGGFVNSLDIYGTKDGIFRADPDTFGNSVLGTTTPTNDARQRGARITYFTPRFGQFTVAMSAGVDQSGGPNAARDCSTNACSDWEVGLRYAATFGEFGLSNGISYGQAKTNDAARTPTLVKANLEAASDLWTFSASYANQTNSSGGAADGHSFGFGAARQIDSNWSLGVSHFYGEIVDWRHIGFGPRMSLRTTTFTASRAINDNAEIGILAGFGQYREDVGDAGFGTPGDSFKTAFVGLVATLRF